MAVLGDGAFGLVLIWGLATLVLDAVRMRPRDPNRTPGASWWRVLVEVKQQPVDAPLFVSGFVLILITGPAVDGSDWWLSLSLLVGAFQAWYLWRYPEPWTRRGNRTAAAQANVPEPPSHVHRVPLVVKEPNENRHRGQER